MRLIDVDKLIEDIEKLNQELLKDLEYADTEVLKVTNKAQLYIICESVIPKIKEQPTAYDVDIRDTQLELHTIKLLTLGAKAYATWFEVITSKMRNNDEIAKLFFELPTVQGTSNIMSLERLKDSNIDVNSISSLEDIIKAIS